MKKLVRLEGAMKLVVKELKEKLAEQKLKIGE